MARTKDPQLQAERRQLVLDAVFDLLAEGSWRSMTLSAVARRAGVSKGLVTYWFSSKDALILAAVQRFHEDYGARLTAAAAGTRPTRERLRKLLVVAFPSQEQVAREVRFQAEVWSFAKTQPHAEQAVRQAYDAFRLACQALLAVGVQDGYVTAKQADRLYPFIHALIDGLSLHLAWGEPVDIKRLRKDLLVRLEQWLRPG